MTQSPDADDVGALSGRMAGSDRCLCGLGVPAPRSRSVAEEKGGGPGADSVSADSAEGGQGRGEGGVPGRGKARQDPHSFGILARASGKIKWSNLSWFRSAGEYSNIYFCRAFGEAVLAPQISESTKFFVCKPRRRRRRHLDSQLASSGGKWIWRRSGASRRSAVFLLPLLLTSPSHRHYLVCFCVAHISLQFFFFPPFILSSEQNF